MKNLPYYLILYYLIIFLSQSENYSSYYISIPFKRNIIELSKCTDLTEFLRLYIDNPIPFYSEINMGSPKKAIKLLYETGSSNFLLWNQLGEEDINPKASNTYYDYKNSESFFNYSDSNTFKDKFYFEEKNAKTKEKKTLEDLFNFTLYTIKIKDNELINKYNLFNFNDNENFYCKIGLGLPASYNVEKVQHILYQLKRKNLTNFYSFSLDLKNNNLLLGDLPQLVLTNKYKESDFVSTYFNLQVGLFIYKLLFKTISIRKKDTNEKIDVMQDTSYFSFEQSYFTGTFEYQNIIETEFFNIYKDECYQKEVEVSDENDYMFGVKKVNVFICKINPEKNILKNFPDLIFYNLELNTDFSFTYEDLFIKISDNNEYLFNVIFDSSTENWIIGLPFFQKYQIIFDVDKKKISYYKGSTENYSDDKENSNKNKKRLWAYLGIIFVLAVIFIVVGYFIGKFVNKKRNKKANELKDDDYDYEAENDIN